MAENSAVSRGGQPPLEVRLERLRLERKRIVSGAALKEVTAEITDLEVRLAKKQERDRRRALRKRGLGGELAQVIAEKDEAAERLRQMEQDLAKAKENALLLVELARDPELKRRMVEAQQKLARTQA